MKFWYHGLDYYERSQEEIFITLSYSVNHNKSCFKSTLLIMTPEILNSAEESYIKVTRTWKYTISCVSFIIPHRANQSDDTDWNIRVCTDLGQESDFSFIRFGPGFHFFCSVRLGCTSFWIELPFFPFNGMITYY